ncbi:MAG TPA: methyl-accepting chemotaxis protein, partial [Myxococcales bacterium]|nr:methyl-accepting chemotaxis protein [Myxococcales bacterium]
MSWTPADVPRWILRRVRSRLGIRLAVSVSLLAVGPLVLLSLVLAYRTRAVMADQVHGTLVAEAQGFAAAVERSLFEREASLRGWAEDPILLGGLIYGSYDKSNAVLAGFQRRYPMFRGLLLLDTAGNAVAASAPALLKDARASGALAGRPWFQDALAGRRAVEPPAGADPLFRAKVLLLAEPLLDREGRPLGVVAGAYDWADVAKTAHPAVERAKARGQPSLDLLIGDRHGHPLFDSSGGRALSLQGWTREGGGDRVAVREGRVVAWAMNQSDLASVADAWVFAATVEEGEAYGLARSMLWAVGLGSGVLVALAVLLAFRLSRQMIEPIRELQRSVTTIVKDRDLTTRVPVSTADEIGDLAAAFSQLVERMREMLHRLRQSAFAFSSAAQALHAATDDQKLAFTRQAFTLEEASTTAKEIKQTSQLAARKAESMLQAAARADTVGKESEASLVVTL